MIYRVAVERTRLSAGVWRFLRLKKSLLKVGFTLSSIRRNDSKGYRETIEP